MTLVAAQLDPSVRSVHRAPNRANLLHHPYKLRNHSVMKILRLSHQLKSLQYQRMSNQIPTSTTSKIRTRIIRLRQRRASSKMSTHRERMMIRVLLKAMQMKFHPQMFLKNRRRKNPSLIKPHRVPQKTNHSRIAALWNQQRLILRRPRSSQTKGKNCLSIRSIRIRMASMKKKTKATVRREPTKRARVTPTCSPS